jgi:hypothetical protein
MSFQAPERPGLLLITPRDLRERWPAHLVATAAETRELPAAHNRLR